MICSLQSNMFSFVHLLSMYSIKKRQRQHRDEHCNWLLPSRTRWSCFSQFAEQIFSQKTPAAAPRLTCSIWLFIESQHALICLSVFERLLVKNPCGSIEMSVWLFSLEIMISQLSSFSALEQHRIQLNVEQNTARLTLEWRGARGQGPERCSYASLLTA